MSVTVAASVGATAVDDLRRAWSRQLGRGEATVVGHQSMAVAWSTRCRWVDTFDDGDLLVVLDGRLHDVAPLGSQAAAIAERYRRRADGLAQGLDGDFVLLVLERSNRTLLVARDPLGVRPWYQSSKGERHAGSSEVATLVAIDWVDREVDEKKAIEYLAAMNTSTGRTFHRGITTLEPGTTWVHEDGLTRQRRHHRWRLQPDVVTTWDEASQGCRRLLDAAVARRLEVMGPATSELSGGLDSSAVVGTVMNLGRRDLMAGRLVFDTPRADERSYSDAVIDRWQVPVVSASPWIPDAEEAIALTGQLARPLPDPHFLMFANLRRTLRDEGRPDLLTGLGGDDAFTSADGGTLALSAVKLRRSKELRRIFRSTVLDPRASWREVHRPMLHQLAWWRGDRLPGWVSPSAASVGDLHRWFHRRPPRVTGVPATDERITNISEGYDAAVLETQAIVSDLVGARATHPFLDRRFIEVTYGFDPFWPTRGGHDRALQVDAYRDRIPRLVLDRRWKADFSEMFWPQVLPSAVLADVTTGPLVARGWLDPAGFADLVQRGNAAMPNAAIPLIRCVALDRWLRSR